MKKIALRVQFQCLNYFRNNIYYYTELMIVKYLDNVGVDSGLSKTL